MNKSVSMFEKKLLKKLKEASLIRQRAVENHYASYFNDNFQDLSEFILKNPIRSHLSLRMFKDVINVYNSLQKTNVIIWERIKSYLILYALKEVYTPYLNKEILPLEKERLRKILYEFVEKVERL